MTIRKHILENTLLSLSFEEGRWTSFSMKGRKESFIDALLPYEATGIKVDWIGTSVTNYGKPGVQSAKEPLVPEGDWTESSGMEFTGALEMPGILKMTYRITGDWTVDISYSLPPDSLEISRDIEFRYTGDKTGFVRELFLGAPFMKIDGKDKDIFEIYDTRNNFANLRHLAGTEETSFPGERVPGKDHRISAMDCDCHHENSAVIHSAEKEISLFMWAFSPDLEAVAYSYDETCSALSFRQHWLAFSRLEKGTVIKCAKQFISVLKGDWKTMLESVSEFKKDHGWLAPEFPDELKKSVIYQAHGFLMDFGGFAGLAERLEKIKELGADVLYLPPLAPPEAYLNYLPDMVAPCYGTADDFRVLVQKAHSLGMKVIVDMIAHHLYFKSPAFEKRSFMRFDEKGNPLTYSIGALVTETRNPEYIDYYTGCCRKLVLDYDIDGFRFDVAGFQLPSWEGSAFYKRPGMGVLGQIELFTKMKADLDPIKKLIYFEEGMGINGFRYVTHGWIKFLKFMRSTEVADSEKLSFMMQKLKAMLQDRALKERPGCVTAYHLKIHDTALLQSMGLAIDGMDRALAALCMTIDGIPFLTMGIERGCFDFIKSLADARRKFNALSRGQYDFDSVSASRPEIFCFERVWNDERVLVAINFSSCEISSVLQGRGYSATLNFKAFESKIIVDGKDVVNHETSRVEQPGICKWKILEESSSEIVVADENGRNKFSIDLANGFISRIGNSAAGAFKCRESLVAASSEAITKIDADEGSFSGEFSSDDHVSELIPEDGWEKNDFDDLSWLEAFVPSTRLPYCMIGTDSNAKYIEDVVPDEIELLWSRHPGMINGSSYYRKKFVLNETPETAILKIFSPSLYDFDSVKASGGIPENISESFNRINLFVNGVEVSPQSQDIARFLKAGENLLAVQVARSQYSRGLVAELKIGSTVSVCSDSSWKVFPGKEYRPAALNHKIEYGADKSLKSVTIHTNLLESHYSFSGDGSVGLRLTPVNVRVPVKLYFSLNIPGASAWSAIHCDGSIYKGAAGFWSSMKNSYGGAEIPEYSSAEIRSSETESINLEKIIEFSSFEGLEKRIYSEPDGIMLFFIGKVLPEGDKKSFNLTFKLL